jgi:hypothetical protein
LLGIEDNVRSTKVSSKINTDLINIFQMPVSYKDGHLY